MHILRNTICRWDSSLDPPFTFNRHHHISFDNVFSLYFEICGYRHRVRAFYFFGTPDIFWVHQSLFACNIPVRNSIAQKNYRIGCILMFWFA
jgi:hypothetical protein